MSRHVERGLLLLRQRRHQDAIREFHGALGEDSEDALAHAYLAIAYAGQGSWKDAGEHARQGVQLAPDQPFAHYAHAVVLHDRHRFDEALIAIKEAIRLDPHDAAKFDVLASIHMARRAWRSALEAADAGLAVDPEHAGCTNLRSRALIQLGDRERAATTIDGALRRRPDDPDTHATQGWAALHAADPKQAIGHFREALRLDPTSADARSGIVEALKARNPLYRLLLGYFLWSGRLDGRIRFGLCVAGFIAARVLRQVARSNPALELPAMILLGLYGGFVILTWIGDACFNLLLLLDADGRHALDDDDRRGAFLFGAICLLALLLLVAGIASGSAALVSGAILTGFTAIVVTSIHGCAPGWPRRLMATAVAAVAILALALTGALVAGEITGQGPAVLREGPGNIVALLFPVTLLITMLLPNFLVGIRPRR